MSALHHVALRCRDFDRSVAFYQDVMGLRPLLGFKIDQGTRRVLLMAGEDSVRVELFESPSHPETEQDPLFMHLCFRSDDCRSDLERVRAAGYEVTEEARTVTLENWCSDQADAAPSNCEVTFGFFKGPDGELLEFFENSDT